MGPSLQRRVILRTGWLINAKRAYLRTALGSNTPVCLLICSCRCNPPKSCSCLLRLSLCLYGTCLARHQPLRPTSTGTWRACAFL